MSAEAGDARDLPRPPKLVADPFKGPAEPTAPRMVEPDPKDIVFVSYPDTLDGIVAAWVVRHFAKLASIPVELSRDHGDATALADRNVIVLGAGVIPDGSKSLLAFTQLKHGVPEPLPFKTWERTIPYGVKTMSPSGHVASAVCDPKRSLTALAWDFFNADRLGFEKRPRLIEHLNDYVTADPAKPYAYQDTPDIVACLESYTPLDFGLLDRLVDACNDRKKREFLIVGGQAVLRQVKKANAAAAIRAGAASVTE